jgi:hypothetical protein
MILWAKGIKMADNQIKISVNLDSKEFDQNFKRIMDQVNKLRQATSGIPGLGGGPAGGASSKVGEANQSVNAQQSNRSLQGLQKTLDGLAGRTDTFNKSLSALSKTLDDLSNKAQQAATTTNQVAAAQQTVAGIRAKPEGMDRLLTALQKGGVGGLTTAMGRMGAGGVLGAVGPGLAGAASGVGSAMAAYGSFQAFRAGLPGREAERDVGIARGAGQLRERAIRGESFEDIAFAPERAKAVKKSMDFFKEAQDAREYRATGKGLASAVGIAGTAIAGGKIGLALGGPIGAGVGALAGGGLAYAMGKGVGLTDEEAYYGLTRNKGALAKMTGKEAMQEQEKYYLQEMMKDPYKYSQTKFLGENRDLLSRVQKSTGLSDKGMYGEEGFVQRGANQFLFAERAGMQQQIAGAGGTVSGQSNVHLMALQAQRNLGLTNSGQAMGRLTNYLKPNESEDAFVKILAKGFSVGLDDSDYREESKDYLAQVTAIASRMGGGAEFVASRMAAGIEGDVSRRGVERAAEQFQTLKQMEEETGGVTGAAKFRLMAEDPLAKKLTGDAALQYQRLDRASLERGEEDPMVMALYREATKGMSEKDIAKTGGVGGFIQRGKENLTKSTVAGYAGGGELLEMKNQYQEMMSKPIMERDEGTLQELKDKIMLRGGRIFGGKGGLETESLLNQFLAPTGVGEDYMKKAQESLMGKPQLGLDKINEQEAQRQSEQFKGFQENVETIFKDAMKNAGQSLADQLVMETFNKKLGEGATAVQTFIDAYGSMANKPKPLPSGVSSQDKGLTNGKQKTPVGQ